MPTLTTPTPNTWISCKRTGIRHFDYRNIQGVEIRSDSLSEDDMWVDFIETLPVQHGIFFELRYHNKPDESHLGVFLLEEKATQEQLRALSNPATMKKWLTDEQEMCIGRIGTSVLIRHVKYENCFSVYPHLYLRFVDEFDCSSDIDVYLKFDKQDRGSLRCKQFRSCMVEYKTNQRKCLGTRVLGPDIQNAFDCVAFFCFLCYVVLRFLILDDKVNRSAISKSALSETVSHLDNIGLVLLVVYFMLNTFLEQLALYWWKEQKGDGDSDRIESVDYGKLPEFQRLPFCPSNVLESSPVCTDYDDDYEPENKEHNKTSELKEMIEQLSCKLQTLETQLQGKGEQEKPDEMVAAAKTAQSKKEE